jgi:hypothetical protein
VFDIDKSVLFASDEDDRTCDLVDHLDGLQFPDVEVGHLLLPEHLFNVLLNGIDYSVD